MIDQNSVNSEKYWDKRFTGNWDDEQGDKQSIFFADITRELLPKWFVDHVNNGNLSVCDWGCAEGDGTEVVRSFLPNSKIYGIDFSDNAIKSAAKKYPKIKFDAVDLITEKYSKQFDVIYASNIFEHFEDPWATFAKISQYASKYFVVQVPYREPVDKRIPEHFASFFTDDFFNHRSDEWRVVHIAAVDVSRRQPTYWAGSQILVIFARQTEEIPSAEQAVQGVASYSMNYLHELQGAIESVITKKIAQDGEIERLQRENSTQKEQLDELWRITNSKRQRVANKLANTVGKVMPKGSPQRYVAKSLYRSVRAVKHTPQYVGKLKDRLEIVRFAKTLRMKATEHKAVIVYCGMPWDNIMRQRPHHLAENLSKLGYLVIYQDPELEGYRIISPELILVGGDWCIDALSPVRDKVNLFYLFPAGYPKSFAKLQSIVNKGFNLIYEYIDELDETISGDLTLQREVFDRLEELHPSFLLASAKKLYRQLEERFPTDKLLLNENAVDSTHFDHTKSGKAPVPNDLKEIVDSGKSIVGYYGAVAPWLDYALINKMTLELSEVEFVFIGVDYNGGLQYLTIRDNVHYLGPKQYAELPNYSSFFDAAIIPFVEGEIAKSTSPVKLFEYMAMGLPTVCTKDLRECQGYEGVLLSRSGEKFIENVQKAIKLRKSTEMRNTLYTQANNNTWVARAKSIDKLIMRHYKKAR